MSEPIDMVKLVRALPSRPRGRSAIVFTYEYSGQKEWAAELARQTDYDHIHLLDHFYNTAELGEMVGQFSASYLFDYLKEYNPSAELLIVSGIEFLKATWVGLTDAGEQFASRVENWNEKTCLLFVMQFDGHIASRKFLRFPQHTYIVDQRETLAL